MRQKAVKLWTTFALALLLAMSAFFAPLTANAESETAIAAVIEHETADEHAHVGAGPCHKAAACEAPVALLHWQKLAISAHAGKLSVMLKGSGQASNAPEAHLPPPKP